MAGNFAGNFRGQTFNALMQPRAVYDRPLTFRGAIAPLGTYQNPDGTEDVGFAWHGSIAANRRNPFLRHWQAFYSWKCDCC